MHQYSTMFSGCYLSLEQGSKLASKLSACIDTHEYIHDQIHRDTQIGTQKDRQRQTETDRDRQTDRRTDRDRQTDRQPDRQRQSVAILAQARVSSREGGPCLGFRWHGGVMAGDPTLAECPCSVGAARRAKRRQAQAAVEGKLVAAYAAVARLEKELEMACQEKDKFGNAVLQLVENLRGDTLPAHPV